MKCNFIHIKLKDKNYIDLNRNRLLELVKLSIENNANYFYYNKNNAKSLNQDSETIYYKNYIKKKILEILYIK